MFDDENVIKYYYIKARSNFGSILEGDEEKGAILKILHLLFV